MTTIDVVSPSEREDLADGGAVDVWTSADDERTTVTAWDERGTLVGLAWFEIGPSGHPRRASVEVTPTQRQRGIGAVLLQRLIAAAAARGVESLTWTHPADDVAVRSLEASGHVPFARRVEGGQTRSTLFVPAA